MPPRHAARELVILVAAVVGLSRLLDGPLLWLVSGLVFAIGCVGARGILVRPDRPAPRIETAILPAVAAALGVGLIRLVPVGIGLVPAIIAVGLLVDRTLALEVRLAGQPTGPSADDRGRVLVTALVVAFLAFGGVAAIVPNGLVELEGLAGGAAPRLPGTDLLVLAGADALVALLLGYRVATLRLPRPADAAWSAIGYAVVIAIGASVLRAIELPRLLGPGLLALVFFLWDAFHSTMPARRRNARWLWEFGLLAALGVLVAWLNLRLPAG